MLGVVFGDVPGVGRSVTNSEKKPPSLLLPLLPEEEELLRDAMVVTLNEVLQGYSTTHTTRESPMTQERVRSVVDASIFIYEKGEKTVNRVSQSRYLKHFSSTTNRRNQRKHSIKEIAVSVSECVFI